MNYLLNKNYFRITLLIQKNNKNSKVITLEFLLWFNNLFL